MDPMLVRAARGLEEMGPMERMRSMWPHGSIMGFMVAHGVTSSPVTKTRNAPEAPKGVCGGPGRETPQE